jgi:O-antigen/teichoic acid export membrane protein
MTIVLGLVLMPVLFRHLAREELGVWLLLGQSSAALALLDFGFGMVLTRRIALAVGKSASGLGGELSQDAINETCDLAATGRRVYRWLALAALAVSLGSGLVYLRSLHLRDVSMPTVWTAWGVLCLSQALGISAAAWTCLLQGVGYVGWDAILASIVNSLTLLLQIVLVLLGGGLVSLASAAAVGALTQRFLIIWFARARRSELFARRGRWRVDLFREMLAPSFRAWLTSLGYLLVANTDQFFIAAHKGTFTIPAYRAAFLLVINLHFMAGVFSGASQVFVSHLWQAGDLGQIQCILKRNARIGLLAMGSGAGAILALGPALFELWLGPGNFVGYPVLGIFLATFILEHHANVFGSCGRATNDEAYALSSVAAGFLKLGLAFLLTNRFGLTGLALSTLIAQGVTNDWFMVYRSVHRLRIRFLEHVHEVLVPCLLMFLATLGLGVLMHNLIRDQRLVVRVGMVSTAATALLCAALWRLALNASQRCRLLRRLKLA